MRKWFFVFFLLLAVLSVIALLRLPRIETTTATTVNCSSLAIDRFLLNRENWMRWWPGETKRNDSLVFKNFYYRIDQVLADGFIATVLGQEDSARLALHVTPSDQNTSLFSWTTEIASYHNPFVRSLSAFSGEAKVAANAQAFAGAVQDFFGRQEAVYGMRIRMQQVKDSSLISTRKVFDHYPSTAEIYGMVSSLKQYIRQKGGVEKDVPMLNVHAENDKYEGMVAIPIARDLPSEGNFQLKKMVLGNILTADVKGGAGRIAEAEKEMQNFVTDYHRTSPAISFQSLITDRQQQPDTNKWATRINYPIF